MGGQIAQRDGSAISSRDTRSRRQQLRHRLIQPDLAADGHVGEQQSGEQLGDRADLEQSFLVHRASAARVAAAIGDEPMAVGFGDADPHANAQAALVDAIAKQPPNRVLGQGGRRDNRCGHNHHSNATRPRRLASTTSRKAIINWPVAFAYYSITLSARSRKDSGMMTSSILAA